MPAERKAVPALGLPAVRFTTRSRPYPRGWVAATRSHALLVTQSAQGHRAQPTERSLSSATLGAIREWA